MLENRRHLRIREITDVRWVVLGKDVAGEGKVFNISTSGLLLQTDAQFDPRRSGVLYIDAHGEAPLEFGPKKGKIVWFRSMPSRPGYQCGVEFLKNLPFDRPLQEWIDRKVEAFAQAENANILNHYIS
ncbi:MAG: PilZ domain-containing protein [Candidatus Omnitrophica bacterium]|nr:PilZ domain-containing protein [Candidatus Omnitrophota bacterium]